jgi:hypothetical protein
MICGAEIPQRFSGYLSLLGTRIHRRCRQVNEVNKSLTGKAVRMKAEGRRTNAPGSLFASASQMNSDMTSST